MGDLIAEILIAIVSNCKNGKVVTAVIVVAIVAVCGVVYYW